MWKPLRTLLRLTRLLLVCTWTSKWEECKWCRIVIWKLICPGKRKQTSFCFVFQYWVITRVWLFKSLGKNLDGSKSREQIDSCFPAPSGNGLVAPWLSAFLGTWGIWGSPHWHYPLGKPEAALIIDEGIQLKAGPYHGNAGMSFMNSFKLWRWEGRCSFNTCLHPYWGIPWPMY